MHLHYYLNYVGFVISNSIDLRHKTNLILETNLILSK